MTVHFHMRKTTRLLLITRTLSEGLDGFAGTKAFSKPASYTVDGIGEVAEFDLAQVCR